MDKASAILILRTLARAIRDGDGELTSEDAQDLENVGDFIALQWRALDRVT
jgi:hypothetical protein